ncbi:response regulator [Azospirillum thermophilum]|uniref:Response regulator n=1 Tax=Azospirillum thermophilum TaxID=2202148 RepID=A0A2S2CY77_9PROT|nr:response regulator [Azospirillum thermophilum]AWK89474.1 response regulator [Azospirillum thermophilum]
MIVSHHLRVLLVEDEAVSAMALAAVCEQAGYRVTCVGNGREGLEAFERAPFDVVVTDLNMPQLDGGRMIRSLRREWPCLPVVVVTGSPPPGGLRELQGSEPGVMALLTKPVAGADLVRAIRGVFAMT